MTKLFKAPDGVSEFHVSSTRAVAVTLTQEWREIPDVLHKDAIIAGADVQSQGVRIEAEKPAEPSASGLDPFQERLQDVLFDILIPDEEGNTDPFNLVKDGQLDLKRLSKVVGYNVDTDSTHVLETWNQVQASYLAQKAELDASVKVPEGKPAKAKK